VECGKEKRRWGLVNGDRDEIAYVDKRYSYTVWLVVRYRMRQHIEYSFLWEIMGEAYMIVALSEK
jgi:hypothetical protein